MSWKLILNKEVAPIEYKTKDAALKAVEALLRGYKMIYMTDTDTGETIQHIYQESESEQQCRQGINKCWSSIYTTGWGF